MLEFSLTRKRENAGDGTSIKRIFGAPIKPRPMPTTAYSPLPGQAAGPLVSWLPQGKGWNLHYFKTTGKDIFWSIPAKRQAHDPSRKTSPLIRPHPVAGPEGPGPLGGRRTVASEATTKASAA